MSGMSCARCAGCYSSGISGSELRRRCPAIFCSAAMIGSIGRVPRVLPQELLVLYRQESLVYEFRTVSGLDVMDSEL